jgi:hypothetical protein
MTVVKQLYHEKANLIWHFSAFEKSSATCYTAISFSLANSCCLHVIEFTLPLII